MGKGWPYAEIALGTAAAAKQVYDWNEERLRPKNGTRPVPQFKLNKMPKFNSGFSMVNVRARNTSKKRMRHRRTAPRDTFTAMAAKVSMNLKAINEIETQRGCMCLPNHKHTNNATNITQHLLPFHLYHLDTTVLTGDTTVNIGKSFVQTLSGTTEPGLSSSMYTKSVNEGESTSNAYTWTNSKTGASFWTDDSTYPDVIARRKWYQKKVDIDLVMYGQTNADTLFRIDIVKMDSRWAQWMRGGTGPAIEELQQWLHAMIAPYTQNPIYKPRQVSNVMTIVKSYKYKIPEQSADYDRIQSVKTRISLPMSRVINRYWRKGCKNPSGGPIDNEDASLMNLETEDNYDQYESDFGYLDPKHMYMMLIRASNTDVTTSIGVGTDAPSARDILPGAEPTYDIQIRSSYIVPS